jgi:hypothetical protein
MKHNSIFKIKIIAGILLVMAVLTLAVGVRLPVSAASGITLSSSVQSAFPNSLTFNVKAQSDANIVQLRIHYTVDHQNAADVTSEGWAVFTPATSVTTQWFWDMRRSSLPPGAKVNYWWTAIDAAGKTAQTSPATISFDDTRFKWQSITTAPVTIEWYNGNAAFANALMTAAQDGLKRIENDTGANPVGNVVIYIYASASDLQSAQLFAQQWEGGVTFSGYDTIAIGVSTNQLSYGQRAVPHELTHWVVGQITFNNYGAGLPTWLDEGLATYGESTTLNPDYQTALNNAIKNNQLLSVRTLSSPFSADPQTAYISYGESNSIATLMIKTYGKDKMNQLLEVFHQGSTYDAALQQVYGFDQDGLDKVWRQSIGVTPIVTATAPTTHKEISLALVGILAGLAVVILLVLGLLAKRWSRRRGR